MLHVPPGPRVSLLRCRRSSVAIVAAMLAPVLAGATGLGIEVSNWSVEQMRMQRAADMAALAGAITYTNAINNGSTTAAAAQSAANAAANLAEVNHVPGPSAPSWDSSTQTLTDSNLTVRITNGVRSASDTAVNVTVHESVPLMLARLVTSVSAVTVTGTSMAELIGNGNGSSTGPQPCVFALQTAADGGTGISANGYTNVNAPGCTLRSNSSMYFTGGGSFNTGGLYADGSIYMPNWVKVKGGVYPNNGVVTDPYLSNTTLQTALTNVSSVTGPNIACTNQQCGLPSSSGSSFNGSYCSGQGSGNVTCYLKPGNYGSLTALGGGPYVFNFAPGLYMFNGNIDLENYTTSNGTGVTIVLSGYFKGANSFNFYVTAPSSAQTASTGGITGVVLAGKTNQTAIIENNPAFVADGVVYFPNATFDASAAPTLGASNNTCLEIIAANILLSGNTYLQSNCSSVNAQGFGSTPGSTTYTATLVQ